MKNILICIDRDGTLVYDKNYNLGSQRDWKNKVKLMPYVIRGLGLLKTIPNVKLYMVTNQPGVAVRNFPLLTLKRAHEVCKYILKKIEKKGVRLDGYFICPHATFEYAKKHPTYSFDKKLTHKCTCMKPNPRMILKALKKEKLSKKNTEIYVIGDRASDVEMALRMNGTGILLPFKNRPREQKKVKDLKGKKFIKKNFLEAGEFIKKDFMRKQINNLKWK